MPDGSTSLDKEEVIIEGSPTPNRDLRPDIPHVGVVSSTGRFIQRDNPNIIRRKGNSEPSFGVKTTVGEPTGKVR